MSATPVKEVSAEGLYDQFTNDDSTFVVVDLRREDYSQGHIKGAWNVPVTGQMTEDDLSTLLEKLNNYTQQKNISQLDVIFHCSSSKNRGPRVANQFSAFIDQNKCYTTYQSCVLVNGYTGWSQLFESKKDSTMIEI